MSIRLGDTKVVTATNQDLNGSANAALLTYVASKPCRLHRFGVVADADEGLLAAMRLKMRLTPVATGTAADIDEAGVLNPGGAVARGLGVYKDAEESKVIDAGDTITVAIDTAAGGTSTGNVFLEIVELPFAGTEIDAMSKSA